MENRVFDIVKSIRLRLGAHLPQPKDSGRLPRWLSTNAPKHGFLLLRYRDDYPPGPNLIPVPPIPSVAWSFRCILDPGLAGLLPNDQDYMAISEYKTGDLHSAWPDGFISSSYGSFRFNSLVLKGSGGLYFRTKYDIVGGAFGIYPTNYNAKSGFIFAPFSLGSSQIKLGDTVRGKNSGAMAKVAYLDMRVRNWGNTGKGVLVLVAIPGQSFTFSDGEILQCQLAALIG